MSATSTAFGATEIAEEGSSKSADAAVPSTSPNDSFASRHRPATPCTIYSCSAVSFENGELVKPAVCPCMPCTHAHSSKISVERIDAGPKFAARLEP